MRARRAVCAALLLHVFAVAMAVTFLGCASAPPEVPPALLERPERPVLANAEEVKQAVADGDTLALVRLYSRNMAELMAYARKLEALLDAHERQMRR